MSKSYINIRSNNNKISYHHGNSYIAQTNQQNTLPTYFPLPEEYSVFEDIDNGFFYLEDTAQHRLISLCLQQLKKSLYQLYELYGILRPLPKLKISHDEDDAIILNWAYVGFRIYINFEVAINNSYYGIVALNGEDKFDSSTGKIDDKNYVSVIEQILHYIMNYT